MKIHGITIAKDEADVIAQTLTSARRWCDHVYVFDNGSEDGTWEVLQELAGTDDRIALYGRDGRAYDNRIRAEVFHAYKHLSRPGDWWCKLDADELYVDDPRAFLARVPEASDLVFGSSFQYYFTDADQMRAEADPAAYADDVPVERKLRYYLNNHSEPRFVRHVDDGIWDTGHPRAKTVYPVRIWLKHYQYRSPAQIERRLGHRLRAARSGSGFRHELKRFGEARGGEDAQVDWRRWVRPARELDVDALDGRLVYREALQCALPQERLRGVAARRLSEAVGRLARRIRPERAGADSDAGRTPDARTPEARTPEARTPEARTPLAPRRSPPGDPPEISVVMPVYDAMPFLREALDDLLAQTFANFELIAVDDGSSDGSRAVLAEYAAREPRLRVIENAENRGISHALNRGLEACTAPLVARADADDRYAPTRLEQQLAFMREHPEVGLLSCFVEKIDADGRPFTRATFPTRDGEIRLRELFVNCFTHPGAMYRTDLVLALGGYDPAFPSAQDADLWNRLLDKTRAANLPSVLVHYRVHGRSSVQRLKKTSVGAMVGGSAPVRRRALERYLGRTLTLEEATSAVLTFRAFVDARPEEVRCGRAVLEEVLAVAQRRETPADGAFVRRAVAEAYLTLAGQRAGTDPALSRSLATAAMRLRPRLAADRRVARLAARALLPRPAADLLATVVARRRRGAA